MNGLGLSSVIVGGLGALASVPLGVALVMVGLVIGGGLALSDDAQVNLFVLFASWFVALPATGLFALVGLGLAIGGLLRPPRALGAVGLGLSALALLLAACAIGFLSLLGSTYQAVEPLLE
jgi:hypothetical protein